MINRLAEIENLHNLEFFVYFYNVSKNYIAVCPKLDIFVFSENRRDTLKELAKKILYFFDVSNIEIVDFFKNNVMIKYKMKFIAAR